MILSYARTPCTAFLSFVAALFLSLASGYTQRPPAPRDDGNVNLLDQASQRLQSLRQGTPPDGVNRVLSTGNQVSNRALKQGSPDVINVQRGQTVTITMPDTIQRLDGGGFTTDPEAEGNFLVSPFPGTRFFSVEPLATGARNNLNVIVDNQVYVLIFQEDASAVSQYSVIYSYPPPATDSENLAPTTRKPFSPARVLSLLDKVKAYDILEKQRPDAVAGIRVTRPFTVTTHPLYDVVLRAVYRDDALDTLVFEMELVSKVPDPKDPSQHLPLGYDPESFEVRVKGKDGNDYRFFQSIADASGRMEGGVRNLAYFAISGDGFGGRNNVDIFNTFEISLTPTGSITATPIIDPFPSDYSKPPALGKGTPVPISTPAPSQAPRAQPTPFSTLPVSPRPMAPMPTVTPRPLVTSALPQAPAQTPQASATPTPQASATPTPQASATPTPQASATPTPQASATPTPQASATPTPQASATPTPQASATPTPQASATPSFKVVEFPRAILVSTPTPSPAPKPTPSPTPLPKPLGTLDENGEVFVSESEPTPPQTPTPSPSPTPDPSSKKYDEQISVQIE